MKKYSLSTLATLLAFSTFVHAADAPKPGVGTSVLPGCEPAMIATVVLITPGKQPGGIIVMVRYADGQLEKLSEFRQGSNNVTTKVGMTVCMAPSYD
jgi:hypothetical protein